MKKVHLIACLLTTWLVPLSLPAQNTLVLEGNSPYQSSAYPDRVVLLPGNSAGTDFVVNWRTHEFLREPQAQLVLAAEHPALEQDAKLLAASSRRLQSDNGVAHFHQVNFSGLAPDTLYAYRVSGDGTWSEWFQFRTAPDAASQQELEVLYLGDAQNSIKSLFGRVVRQAVTTSGVPDLVIHAGDLVDRAGNQDDNWGEWFDALGWLSASVLQLPAAGNHEYDETQTPVARRAHWDAQFPLPANELGALSGSTYFLDRQHVRFIVLDSTPAVHDESFAQRQAQWLEAVLAQNSARWTVVVYHHPMFSVTRGTPNTNLDAHWRLLFERFGVDLVLQGHEHVYGRGQFDAGDATEGTMAGPVYMTSVAGSKMNVVSDLAAARLARTGSNVQLYQHLLFSADSLIVETRTATGELYDRFELQQ